MAILTYLLTAILSIMPQEIQDNNIEIATLGAGCFWCTEAVFDRVDGVLSVESGYSGGHIDNPTYKAVTTGTTGHAEVVQIKFNNSVISFLEILEIFWKTHDPTQLNRQGNDIGTQYRSVIFYHNEKQKSDATSLKLSLGLQEIWDNPIVTTIEEFKSFFSAESYHKDYYATNPNQGYCRFVITPKIEKFEKVFKDYLKP